MGEGAGTSQTSAESEISSGALSGGGYETLRNLRSTRAASFGDWVLDLVSYLSVLPHDRRSP